MSVETISPRESEGFSYPALREVRPTIVLEREALLDNHHKPVEYTFEFPQGETSDVGVIIESGYCASEKTSDGLRHELAQCGIPTATIRLHRTQPRLEALRPDHFLKPHKLHGQAGWAVMKNLRDEMGFGLFDVIGHSYGGAPTADIAELHPEHVRSALFVASVGLEDHSLWEMLCRAKQVAAKEIPPVARKLALDGGAELALDALHHIFRNPSRTFREGVVAAKTDIRPKLKRIRELNVKLGALQFPKDRFFPLDDVVEQSSNLFDAFHIFPDPESNHVTPQEQSMRVALAIKNLLSELHPAA